ncbi:unnamed protein product [Aphanomyces euteiches]
MRECFENVTRLIIAHCLDTILDSDRILVLGAGTAKEYGMPSELLGNKDGAFTQLAQHANIGVDNSDKNIQSLFLYPFVPGLLSKVVGIHPSPKKINNGGSSGDLIHSSKN